MSREVITISTEISAPLERVWKCWTDPMHIPHWSFATEEWHTPKASNDLRKGGKFSSRMEAKDGSAGFDFEGTYDEVIPLELISYHIGDGRKVEITFQKEDQKVMLIEKFEPETTNPIDMQKAGWQAILNNFKKYVETTDD